VELKLGRHAKALMRGAFRQLAMKSFASAGTLLSGRMKPLQQ
jgi:hypothetical protein